MDIITITITALAVACVAAFLLLLAYKWGIVEWLTVHGNDIVSEMAHCDFCMCWWLCVILSLLVVIITNEASALLIALISTPIARKLI